MSDWDILFRGAKLVSADDIGTADVGVIGEQIAAVGVNLSGSAKQAVDAADAFLFPGIIDAHIHFNEPGRDHWEGISSGSRALAAGGGTVFFDMPLTLRRLRWIVKALFKNACSQNRNLSWISGFGEG